jgi:pSer/pThr/pTyr-binding forkhead associated (FHA) protein
MESPLGLDRATEEELAERRAAERRGSPFLLYRDNAGKQHIVELDESHPTVTLGRRFEAEVALHWDQEVSRLHAELAYKAGDWTISDDGMSQNGTYVNEMRIGGRRRLRDGDLVRVGKTTLAFCHPGHATMSAVTLVPSALSSTPSFSEQQQRILHALCRPLFGDGEGLNAATDEQIAEETGIDLEVVVTELDFLGRSLGLEAMPLLEQRAEVAILAIRTGLVKADDA